MPTEQASSLPRTSIVFGEDTPVFSDGTWVRLQGLAARPELNGVSGKIVTFNADRGRYAVQLHPSKERILLKPASLAPTMVVAAAEQALAKREGVASGAASAPDSVDAFDAACEQAMKAIEAKDPSAAAAAARRAISLRPTSCAGHLLLADAANHAADLRTALASYVRAMELAEEGSYNWAKAATSTHEIFMDPGCPSNMPKPAWLNDPQLFHRTSAKVVEATRSIDHPGAQAMAWRMHGDACSEICDHREAAACYRKAAVDLDPRGAEEALCAAEAADTAEAARQAGLGSFGATPTPVPIPASLGPRISAQD